MFKKVVSPKNGTGSLALNSLATVHTSAMNTSSVKIADMGQKEMTIIDEILTSSFFAEHPPVLLDIGASGAIHQAWQPFARHSICIAFDADDREIKDIASASKEYRQLHLLNRLVTDGSSQEADFYLTRFPLCSSTLEPDSASLAQWNFGALFEVERTVRFPAMTLPEALRAAGVDKIDWFKTDSQGTDLRLFTSLGQALISKTLVAEFEPGILDAYKGEDKLHQVMAFMDRQPFWMNSLKVRGTERISRTALARAFGADQQNPHANMPFRTSPGWAEISYFNTFAADATYLYPRDYLLGWVFSLVASQYGFCLDIAMTAQQRFGLPVFGDLVDYSVELVIKNVS